MRLPLHTNFKIEPKIMTKKYLALLITCLILASCQEKKKGYDATGTFEATELTVSAEQNGKLLQFSINEGDQVKEGTQVALVDTVQLWLKAKQIGATKMVYAAQRPDEAKQVAATREQLAKAQTECARYERLVEGGAATQKALDDAQSQVAVLERQLEAQLSALNTSTNSLNAQMSTADIERQQVADQLRKCRVITPIGGTVLEKYAERGEFVSTGKPLFKLADTEHVYLRAYLTSAQLKQVKLGQRVKVFADYGSQQKKEYAGRVTWISSKAEFTPKTILTDDERADLVYAVKVAVHNDGYIKIGMYGEVKL